MRRFKIERYTYTARKSELLHKSQRKPVASGEGMNVEGREALRSAVDTSLPRFYTSMSGIY
jgi:hypothetical protein